MYPSAPYRQRHRTSYHLHGHSPASPWQARAGTCFINTGLRPIPYILGTIYVPTGNPCLLIELVWYLPFSSTNRKSRFGVNGWSAHTRPSAQPE